MKNQNQIIHFRNHMQILTPAVSLLFLLLISCNKEQLSPEAEDGYNSAKLILNEKDIPIDGVFFNECCNEDVYITGTAHITITKNIIHLNISDQVGTGLTTGYLYTQLGNGVETNVFYWSQFEGTLTSKLNMSNDNGCSFKLNATFHITVNANDEVTASFMNLEIDCE